MKKKISILFAVITCLLVFASCGGTEKKPTTDASNTKAETPAETPKEGDTKAITLNYFSMWNESEKQGEVIKKAVEKYEKESGNKVNITWAGRDIEKNIRSLLDGGEKIDIWDQDVVKQINKNSEYMADLSELYAKSYEKLNGKSMNDYMNPALVNLTKTLSKGSMLGVAYQPYTVVFMYNTEHFEKAGITETPKTWEQFLEVCDKLVKAGYVPTTIDDAYRDLPIGYYLAKGKGYEWVGKLVNDKTMFDDPFVLQMAKAFEDMATKGYWDKNVASAVWPAGQNELALGNVSMYLTGTWLPNELLPQTGGEIKFAAFNFPAVPNGELKSTAAMYGAQGFFIPKTSENKDAAFDLIATIVEPEFDLMLSKESNGIPLSTDLEWPELIKDIKPTFDETTDWLPWGGGIDDNSDTKSVMLPKFAELISGKITGEQFVTDMKK